MTLENFNVGDRVRVAQIPAQVVRDRGRFPDTFDLFQKAVGQVYEIRSIDEHGHAELWLRDDGSEDCRGVAHSIYIEREFVQIARGKSNKRMHRTRR